jgi:Lrp/AsnC family leucine-responsive transcriptional regulator
MSNDLDAHDRKIMEALDLNARLGASKIAKQVKISKESVAYRIRRLVEKGYITSFYTIINAALFGFSYYKVFMRFQRLGADDEKKIIDYLLRNSHCINVRRTEGKYNLVFLAAARNRVELKRFLQDFSLQFGEHLVLKNVHTVTAGYKFAQRRVAEDESVQKPFYHGETGEFALKDLDKRILSGIENNARLSTVELSSRTGADIRQVQYDLKKLQEKGIIVGYSTALNLSVIPQLLIMVNFRLKNLSKTPSIIEFFDRRQGCLFAYELIGDFDLSLEMYVENDTQIQGLLREFHDQFADHYISYDLCHVYEEHIAGWYPLPPEPPQA